MWIIKKELENEVVVCVVGFWGMGGFVEYERFGPDEQAEAERKCHYLNGGSWHLLPGEER